MLTGLLRHSPSHRQVLRQRAWELRRALARREAIERHAALEREIGCALPVMPFLMDANLGVPSYASRFQKGRR